MAKNVICLLSIIILFCSTCFSSVYAKSNDENCSEDLLCAIDVAYQLREEYGFGDDDFSCLFAQFMGKRMRKRLHSLFTIEWPKTATDP